ncbi:hypothetical protein Sste5346_000049 [Sporothrix stenoceras]|uniref:ABC multidrug transporter n=1 Tax=Sporothrix stenoceras TaxID=5173 RepID=A0ABR3ZRW8_9PEZI
MSSLATQVALAIGLCGQAVVIVDQTIALRYNDNVHTVPTEHLLDVVWLTSSTVVAFLSFMSLWRYRDATPRGIYCFLQCLFLTCRLGLTDGATSSTHPMDINTAFQLLYALAFSLDTLSFTGVTPGSNIMDLTGKSMALSGLSLFNRASCAWMDPLLLQGVNAADKGPVTADDAGDTGDAGYFLGDTFDAYCKRLAIYTETHAGAWAASVGFLLREHPGLVIQSAVLHLYEDVSKLAVPWMLRRLLAQPSMNYAMVLFCVRSVGAVCSCLSDFYTRVLSVQYRAAVTAAVHHKTMRLLGGSECKSKTESEGEGQGGGEKTADVSTLSEVDGLRLLQFVQSMHDFWSFPLQVVLCLAGLVYILPWEASVAVVLLMLITMYVLTSVSSIARSRVGRNLAAKDQRTQLTAELFHCIKAVKMYTWEHAFGAKLHAYRRDELDATRSMAVVDAVLVSMAQAVPALMTIAAFGAMVWKGSSLLDNELVFPAIMLFTMLNGALTQLASLVMRGEAMKSAVRRIRAYLLLPESDSVLHVPYRDDDADADDDDDAGGDENNISTLGSGTSSTPGLVQVRDLSLSWPSSSTPTCFISGANLVVTPGTLCAIIGATGSGKTSLLKALSGYMMPTAGSVSIHGVVAYVPCRPFLTGGTIRDNILFGRDYDANLYSRVVHACALDTDLVQLPQGDGTLLTASGSVTLSGGQKTRIGLARAAYAQADVYLLDESLANLDVVVQNLVLARLLGPQGLLRSATRVVVSNVPLLLDHADAVYVLEFGILMPTLMQTSGSGASSSSNTPTHLPDAAPSTVLLPIPAPATAELGEEENSAPLLPSGPSPSPAQPPPSPQHYDLRKYLAYATPWGWQMSLLILLAGRLASLASTYVLKWMPFETENRGLVHDLALFAGLTGAQTLLFFVFICCVYYLCFLPTAQRLHDRLLAAMLARSMAFFERTPAGELLNYFSNDLARLDLSLPGSLLTLLAQALNFALACSVLAASSPASLVFVGPLVLLYLSMQRQYLARLRDLRGRESQARAPLVTYLQEAQHGHMLFALHGCIDARVRVFGQALDDHLQALLPLSCIDVWLAYRLELLALALQVLALDVLLANKVEASTVGFVMTYVFQITTILRVIARASAMFASDYVSFSRVQQEIDASDVDDAVPASSSVTLQPTAVPAVLPPRWPSAGHIAFRGYSAAYRSGTPPVLHAVSADILPGEHIAIVGRTGAGKSSLVLALLGMMHGVAGTVVVDGIDVASIDPGQLRRRIALIPQDPLLFSLTVRENLDPLGAYTDADLVRVLRASGAATAIASAVQRQQRQQRQTPDQESVDSHLLSSEYSLLDMQLQGGSGGSSGFSAGEIQLVAVARAMLVQSSVLLLDEATSSVDSATAASIERCLLSQNANASRPMTILSVMHRLESTITTYDKVMVLDKGHLVAYGTPSALLVDEKGPYESMLAEAGLLDYAKSVLGHAADI